MSDDFGKLLDRTWAHKRVLSAQITTPEIDALYERCKQAGALGGKLLGAGGGGFLLLYVPHSKQTALTEQFSDDRFVPVRFDCSGSKLIYEE